MSDVPAASGAAPAGGTPPPAPMPLPGMTAPPGLPDPQMIAQLATAIYHGVGTAGTMGRRAGMGGPPEGVSAKPGGPPRDGTGGPMDALLGAPGPSRAPAAPPPGPASSLGAMDPLRAALALPQVYQLAAGASSVPGAPAGAPDAPDYYFLRPSQAPATQPASSPPGAGAGARAPAAGAKAQPKEAPRQDEPMATGFPVDAIRRDFPALHQQVNGHPLAWLDNAATTHKPRQVIDAISRFYERDNSNVHRGAHTLATRATEAYEGAREKVRRFLGASSTREIVFVRGTTEAINLVAQAWGRQHLRAGDEIVLTELEHHANIVPWQMLADERGARLRVAPINDTGEVDLEAYARLFGPRTKIAAFAHASNVLGTIQPVRAMVEIARAHGAVTVVDGAQAVPHMPVDVRLMGVDFYCFSGHKVFGPTGVGVLYGREALLEEMTPWQGGGSMIKDVTFERTTYSDLPHKFEAGTPALAPAIGLGAAIDYLHELGPADAAAYEQSLLHHATDGLGAIPGVRLIGTSACKVGAVSFVLDPIPPEVIARHLDARGIAVRAGHHCAQPTVRHYGYEATVRPSVAFYNTYGEINRLIQAVDEARRKFA